MDGVDLQPAAAGVGGGSQARIGVAGDGVLGIGWIVGPGEQDDAGTHKAAKIVHVAIGLVIIDAPAKPDNLRNVEIVAQARLDFRPAEVGVAVRVQQALFRGDERALAVHMKGAALQHEIGGVAVEAGQGQYRVGPRRHPDANRRRGRLGDRPTH